MPRSNATCFELFAQHSIAVMARIEAAKTPADRFAAAHTLKGSARAVGAGRSQPRLPTWRRAWMR